MKDKIYTGIKFYRYEDGKDIPEIIRIRNVDYDKKIVKYTTSDNSKSKMLIKDLRSKYRMLSPDALISFISAKCGYSNDVIVALAKFPKNIETSGDNDPVYAVCRQMVCDVFTKNITPDNDVIGMSISKDTCPPNVDFNLMLACDSVNKSKMIATYIDDNLDSILDLFDTEVYDKVFEELNNQYKIAGLSTSLRDLLEKNNFMYDFRKCFGILEIPNEVDEETESLDVVNTQYLAKELNVNITETYVIRYTKEIDLRTIKRDYVIVSTAASKFSKVYIVGYDKE